VGSSDSRGPGHGTSGPRNKSPRTLETYGEAVGQFVNPVGREGIVEVGGVEVAHIESFIADLLAVYSPATANNRFRLRERF